MLMQSYFLNIYFQSVCVQTSECVCIVFVLQCVFAECVFQTSVYAFQSSALGKTEPLSFVAQLFACLSASDRCHVSLPSLLRYGLVYPVNRKKN